MSEFQLYITLEELQAYADQLLTYAMTLPPPPLPVKTVQVCNTIRKPIIIQPHPYNHLVVPVEKKQEESKALSPPPPSPPVIELNKNRIGRVSSIQINREQLEFEASRHLLDIDFLESDMNELTFPSFEHLLHSTSNRKEVHQQQRDPSKLVRHRLSLYKPLRSRVKRAKSTPHLGKQTNK
ncbi:hypothetical protein K501DRAFT_332992 [Backusella circina FSU 941]|nr:hypothetical protein K501DRAFT_332992 [Backusella circina FSU 941]